MRTAPTHSIAAERAICKPTHTKHEMENDMNDDIAVGAEAAAVVLLEHVSSKPAHTRKFQ